MKENIPLGIYQHYKVNNLYEVIGFARHSETLEEMVIYKALFHCDKFGQNQVWVRSKTMFLEDVIYNGQVVPRFKLVEEKYN